MKAILLIAAIGLVAGCSSKFHTDMQNMFGANIEVYYSKAHNLVCFTETGKNGGLQCNSATGFNVQGFEDEKWSVL